MGPRRSPPINLSLDALHQGKGIGERLLRWLAHNIHRRGAPALLLEVRPSNTRALRLYERLGMQHIGVRRGYYPFFNGKREDAIVMRVALPLLPAEATLQEPVGERGASHAD